MQERGSELYNAVLISLGRAPSGVRLTAELQQEAAVYCNELLQNPMGWIDCLHHVQAVAEHAVQCAQAAQEAGNGPLEAPPGSGLDEQGQQVLFFCLEVLRNTVDVHWDQLDDGQRQSIQETSFILIRDLIGGRGDSVEKRIAANDGGSSGVGGGGGGIGDDPAACWVDSLAPRLSSYVLNKLAVLLTSMVKAEFLGAWPTFFADFIGLVRETRCAEIANLWFVFLRTVHADIVAAHPNQTRAVIEHTARIKDSMRITCNTDIVEDIRALLALVSQGHGGATELELAHGALSTLVLYISWIDINLVANEEMISMFYAFLESPGLRSEACKCLLEVMSKGMDQGSKLALLRQLRVLDVIGQINIGEQALRDGDEEATEFAGHVAGLVNMLGVELIDCVQAGLGGEEMMQQTLELGWAYLSTFPHTISSEVVEMLAKYTQMLQQHCASAGDSSGFMDEFLRIFSVATSAMVWPEELYRLEGEDYDRKIFDAFHAELLKMVNCVFRAVPDMSIVQVRLHYEDKLEKLAAGEPSPGYLCCQLDTSICLLNMLSQAVSSIPARMAANDADTVALGEVLFKSGPQVCCYPEERIVSGYFGLLPRYTSFVDTHIDVLEPVISLFAGEYGICHPHLAVASEASKCMLRFFRAITSNSRRSAAPYVQDTLQCIMRALAPVLEAHVLDNSAEDGRPLHDNTPPLLPTVTYCKLSECAGLLSGTGVCGEESVNYMRGFMQMFVDSLQMWLGEDSKVDGKVDIDSVPEQLALAVHEDAELAGRGLERLLLIAGSFSKKVVSSDSAILLEAGFGLILEKSLQSFSLLPQHPSIRRSLTIILHRAITCLGLGLCPYLPNALNALLTHTDTHEQLLDFLTLLNLITETFSTNIIELLDELFMPIVNRVFEYIASFDDRIEQAGGADAPAAAVANHIGQRSAMLRAYYGFVQEMLLAPHVATIILASERNTEHLGDLLRTMIEGAAQQQHSDLQINRCALLSVRVFVHLIGAQPGDVVIEPLHGGRTVSARAALAAKALVEQGVVGTSPIDEGLRNFVFQEVNEAVFSVLFSSKFRTEDPSSRQFLQESLTFQCTVLGSPGFDSDEFAHAVGSILVEQVGIDEESAQEYLHLLAAAATTKGFDIPHMKGLRKFIIDMVRSRRQ